MVTTSVTPTPVQGPAAKPVSPETTRKHPSIEDRVDLLMVRAANSLAVRRGEKPVAWSEFKKKLVR